MTDTTPALVLRNRHTDETLALRRVVRGGETWLELKGSLPPKRQGPPLHIHHFEVEEGLVKAGTFSAEIDGRRLQFIPTVVFVGTLLGRYRGHDWPGCPDRLKPVPLAAEAV